MTAITVIANVLVLVAFGVHVVLGDGEVRKVEPLPDAEPAQREAWTVTRAGWHWVSVDLLVATALLGIANFTSLFGDAEHAVVLAVAAYFALQSVTWLITLTVSRPFPQRYLKLGQWMLVLVIAGLLVVGAR